MPGQIARTIANKKPDRKVSNAPTNQNGEAKSLKFAPSYDCRGQRKASRAAYRLREREKGGRGEGGRERPRPLSFTDTDRHAGGAEGHVRETWREVMGEPA